MAISKKQKELDDLKWKVGEELGCDPCGTFEYCKSCKKEEENPCEKAVKRYKTNLRRNEKKKQSKQAIGGLQFRATVVDK